MFKPLLKLLLETTLSEAGKLAVRAIKKLFNKKSQKDENTGIARKGR